MSTRFRLGISGSSFLHVVPREVAKAVFVTAQHGVPRQLDDHQNGLMVEFMRRMTGAMARPEVACVECYHSMVWDRDAVLDVVAADTAVEHWSVHAPYGRCFDPSSPDPDIRRGAAAAAADAIEAAARIGAGIVVAHPGADVDYPVSRDERLGHAVDTLKLAADLAAANGIRLAVEPLPKSEVGNTLDELLEIVDRLDPPGVGINFDVNHLFPPEEIPGMIRRAGPRILSVHVSDQDGEERHWLPFEGSIDWLETLQALDEVGYKGPLIYETHIRNARTCDDVVGAIVDNYVKLRALGGSICWL